MFNDQTDQMFCFVLVFLLNFQKVYVLDTICSMLQKHDFSGKTSHPYFTILLLSLHSHLSACSAPQTHPHSALSASRIWFPTFPPSQTPAAVNHRRGYGSESDSQRRPHHCARVRGTGSGLGGFGGVTQDWRQGERWLTKKVGGDTEYVSRVWQMNWCKEEEVITW